jgi:hypothetical protein
VGKAATMAVVAVLSVAVWQFEPVVGPALPVALVGLVVAVAAATTRGPWQRLAVVATAADAVVLLWWYASQPTALPSHPLWAYVGIACLVGASAALGGTVGSVIGGRRSAAAEARRSRTRRRAVV